MLSTQNQHEQIIFPGFGDFFRETTPSTQQELKLKFAKFDLLQPLKNWFDHLKINNRNLAQFIAKTIPSQCPFARDIIVFGRKFAHIPPLCKLNPLYDQFVNLRFRALCYLADECGEDITPYC